ncbi:hypothetical protein [Streptomyces sp. Ru87]|uniref:hypothetical protein n=1 Tax=Streptomyces sp. Ru87 TaxID=2044307 RepID=UPI0015D486A4|nr:hypothetical protein [Streptomyces sp. Ru87]
MPDRRTPNSSLRRLLAAGDWTYEALARAVNALGAENGTCLRYDRTSVAHWLAGTVPRPYVRELIAEALTRRLRRPVTASDLGMGPCEPGPPLDTRPPGGAPSGAVARLTTLCALNADPARRPVLEECVYRADGPDGSPWQDLLARCPAQRRPGGTPEHEREVRHLRDAVDFFHRAGDLGGRHAQTALVSYLRDDVTTRLQTGRSGGPHPALMAQAALLALVLADMYADDLRHGIAQQYHRAGVHLAAEAGDHLVGAVVLSGMGAHALDVGHCRQALRLTEAALRVAPARTPPGTRALLLTRLAPALASAGHRDRALASVAEAEEHCRRAADGGTPGPAGVCDCSRALCAFAKGRTLAALGDRAAAVAALRQSLEHRPASACRWRALTHAEIARLLLADGRLEEACAAWHRFLDDRPQWRSARADRALAGLRRELRGHAAHPRAGAVLGRAERAGKRP